MKVLVLGGYGVFGGRVARLLIEDGFDVIVAGRSFAKASTFVAEFGGTALSLDKEMAQDVRRALDGVSILVDAIGPFQTYHTAPLAELAIECGCHYLDLSDDVDFTTGISRLDTAARNASVMVLSGVSSVPALSSAVIADIRSDISDIALIDMAILPGNRAPRGRSVMKAILSQVGRPLRQWRGGKWVETPAWAGSVRRKLPKGLARSASPIGAPDLALFPDVFKARSVIFRAGLELGIMHHGLRAFGWLHRRGMLPRLDRLITPMLLTAQALSPFGTDQGGMNVVVAGRNPEGRAITRGWRLHMAQGQGPFVPAIPALLMARKIRQGDIDAGARPATRCTTLYEAEAALAAISGTFDTECDDIIPLFEQAIGEQDWAEMPESYRSGHDLWDRHEMRGAASVTRGTGVLARLIGAVFRFPPDSSKTPLHVTMERIEGKEHWTRNFDGQTFKSILSLAGPHKVYEQFGPFKFELGLPIKNSRMEMHLLRGWLFGIALPRWMLPTSQTAEFERNGLFNFDVRLSAPLAGLIVHYKGWLVPDRD